MLFNLGVPIRAEVLSSLKNVSFWVLVSFASNRVLKYGTDTLMAIDVVLIAL